MSFCKPLCCALLFAVMLAPACAKKSNSPEVVAPNSPEVVAPTATAPACDGIVFQGQCTDKGDIVKFGQYPQATEAPEPLEWIVLAVDSPNGKMLLLTKYVIDARAYDPGREIFASWEESDIRRWLNDTGNSGFLRSTYFTAQEQSRLVEVTNKTTPSAIFMADFVQDEAERQQIISEALSMSDESREKVFLLDCQDADNRAYFESIQARSTKATSYAIQNGLPVKKPSDPETANCANVQCDAAWWLRTPGIDEHNATAISGKGMLSIDGLSIDGSRFVTGVRPAVWVRAD